MEKYIRNGHFAKGSMLSKVEAAIKFVNSKLGRVTIISSLEKVSIALKKEAGTIIK